MYSSKALIALGLTLATVVTLSCGNDDAEPEAAIPANSENTAVALGCTPAHEIRTVNDGQLTVAAYVSPPYTSQQDAGIGGVDGAIIAKVAELECLELKATGVAATAFIPTIQSGRADVAIGGIYRTPERAEAVRLTETIWRDGMAFVSKEPITRISELSDKSVGAVQGYLWNDDLGRVLGGGKPRLYPTTDALFADVDSGRIDVGVLATAEAALRVQQKLASGIKVFDVEADERVEASKAPGEIVFAHTKGNDALTRALNEDIARLRREGTIAAILKEHGLPNSAGQGG